MNDGGGGGGLPVLLPSADTFENSNRAALLAWQERQRRQRTLRMLMMFLMMLLLMEGEDPPNGRHRHGRGRHQHLRSRHDGLGRHWDALGLLDEDGRPFAPLALAVYQSRVDQDELIRRAAREGADGRYHALVRKNGGRDVEEELRRWIAELRGVWVAEEAALLEDATRLAGLEAAGPDKEGSREQRKRGAATGGAAAEVLGEVLQRRKEMKELDDLTVFHYPRNATGYYRGIWVRSLPNQTREDEGVVRGREGDEKKRSHVASAVLPRNNFTLLEAHTWAQARLHAQGKAAGVLFLPPGMCFPRDAAANATGPGAADSRGPSKTTEGTHGHCQLGEAPVPAVLQPVPSSLGLSNPAGRVAFQLYSRPIPAMHQLSVVDGLVRLYDSTTTSFVSRRTDVLVRVKGVAVHGTGQVSVVSCGASGKDEGEKRRSILGVGKVPFGRGEAVRGGVLSPTARTTTSRSDDGQEEENNESLGGRRRLQAAVEQLLTEDDSSSSSDALLAQVRKDVMDLHASLYLDDEWTPDNDRFESYLEEGWESLFHSEKEQEPEMLLSPTEDHKRYTAADELLLGKDVAKKTARRRLPKMEGGSSLLSTDLNEATTTKENGTGLASLALEKPLSNSSLTDGIIWRHLESSSMRNDDDEWPSPTQQKYVYRAPYAADDAAGSLDKAQSPAFRPLPSRDRTLEANALACEFELNLDVRAAPWTYGEWRAGAEHRLRMGRVFHPHWHGATSVRELTRSQYLGALFRIDSLEERATPPREALVANLVGELRSENCHFHSFVNVTAMRTNWEHTTAKAINYSFYMMLTCLAQIVILLRQLLHTQSQSVASNVSLLCIGWQTVLDAMLCISHIFLCLVMQPLFTAFASVAFFKLLIFCVIEMKYMAIIIQARNSASNASLTPEDLRRQITFLHLKCYGALMAALLAFWYLGQAHRVLYILLLYSFWVPQIVRNIVTESRKPMHPYYVYGMSATRAIAPIYVFAVRNNFLREVNPDFPSEPKMCQLLLLWIAVQTAVLYAQSKYGTRFMIPQRFLPPKFDYSRPIPPALLPCPLTPQTNNSSNNGPLSPEIELAPLISVVDGTPSSSERGSGVTRNRRGGGINRARLDSGRAENSNGRMTPTTNMSEDTRDTPTLDCVICYNEIDVNDRLGYMLAPCDHIFHRHCLEQWMDVKMECPICRCNLPSL